MKQPLRRLQPGGLTGVLFLSIALCAVPGRAQVISSNFGPNQNLAGDTSLWCVSGATNANCGVTTFREVAQWFSNFGSATPLGSISLPLGCNSGTNGVIISLAQQGELTGVGAVPGNVLESWSVTNIPCGYPPALTVLNDRLNLVLQSMATYFVVVQPMAPDALVVWYNTALSGYPVWTNSGTGWNFIGTGPGPALIVSGTQQNSFAHIALDGGWTTQISLTNPSSIAGAILPVTVQFYTESGSPWNLSVTTTQNGVTQTSTGFSVTAALGPNSTMVISAGGSSGTTVVGSAQVLSAGVVDGFAIFDYNPQGGTESEGTSPLQAQSPYSISLPFDNTASYAMGVALANLAATSQTITVTIWNASGVQLPSPPPIVLAGNGHTSFMLPSQYAVTAGLRGTVQFVSSGGGLSGLGLRFDPALSFTSVPTTVNGPLGQ